MNDLEAGTVDRQTTNDVGVGGSDIAK